MAAEPRLLRYGRAAWAALGLLAVVVLSLYALQQVRVVVVGFVLALFPAALLSPLAVRLRQSRIPDALGALALVLGLLLAFMVPVRLIVPLIADQVPELADAVAQGLEQLEGVIDWSALPGSPEGPRQLAEQVFAALAEGGVLDRGLAAAGTAVSFVTGLVLMIVTLFFLLKDGRRLWDAVLSLLPRGQRRLVDEMAAQAWWTLGAYLRGQLLVALFDAVFIGLGLWALGVPLALPLAVLVFFGGLFPIVGAFVSGLIAVLVALADQGLLTAVLTLVLIIVVQQVEGNVLEPIIMSNIIALHPLVIILAVTAGGLLLGILGAFLAVPLTAIAARIVDRLRGREPAAGPAGP
jgi:putative heme transporter